MQVVELVELLVETVVLLLGTRVDDSKPARNDSAMATTTATATVSFLMPQDILKGHKVLLIRTVRKARIGPFVASTVVMLERPS